MSQLTARVDDIDIQVHRIRGIFQEASRDDKELAAGLGTTLPFTTIQKDIDMACAAIEELHSHIRSTNR